MLISVDVDKAAPLVYVHASYTVYNYILYPEKQIAGIRGIWPSKSKQGK